MKVKLTDVRLSFPDLFEATQYQGQGPFNFGSSFLFPADHPAKAIVDGAIKQVAADKWKDKASQVLAGILGNTNKCCLVDGNSKAYDGYQGNWALTAKRPLEKGRPLVIDGAKNPLVAADGKPYAGCFVNASVEFWAQDNSFGKGIRCTLLGVQFLRDGDAFTAGAPASPDDFEALGQGADAADLA